ncbi:ABC transporter substrate-binding protein [Acuticoccus sediminis]|uniref:ABC transporter substrate-binding protein n=1 Tax=Acuticoccus sediminis TaxID=2184697 RepID=A0A8B2NHL4_9HYPH|nr:tripartite tricarboxylate transporter substrate binding protein [Acuticoccus sediminis]RAH97413.1 ABC transporter substrate-binding protein [Acuticoccus sediminis]
MKRSAFFALAASAILCAAGTASAEDYPAKEITVIVNYGAGGATDLSTRTLAKAAEQHLGVPLKVVNRAGGAGTVGPTVLANSRNDGYTIGVTSFSPMAIQPNMREVPYKLEDFAFLAGTGRYRYGLAVRADSEFETFEDFVAKAKDGKVTISASGPPNNIALHQLAEATGGRFDWIPYPSGNDSAVALLAGEVDATAQNPTDIVKHVKSGEMRMLASLSPVRWFELPDVPTLQDLGYEIAIDSWSGLSAPAGTDPGKIEILQTAFSKAMSDPEVQAQFKNLGMDPDFMSGEDYRKFVVEGRETIGEQLKAIGMTAQ